MAEYRPPDWPSLALRLFAADPQALADFIRTAFGAQVDAPPHRPATVRLDGSVILVSDGGGVRKAMPACVHLYVPDADAAYLSAIEAGARPVEAPADMLYGDRRATVEDRWGNLWQLATWRSKGSI